MMLGLVGLVARLVTRPDARPSSMVVCGVGPMFFSSAIGVGPSGVHVPPVMTFGATGVLPPPLEEISLPRSIAGSNFWIANSPPPLGDGRVGAAVRRLFPSPACGGRLGWGPAADAGQIDPSASIDASTRNARRLGNSGSIMRRRNAKNILPPRPGGGSGWGLQKKGG